VKSRFKIEIKLTIGDWMLEITAIVGLALLFSMVVFNYDDLPVIIPKHFSVMGRTNDIGSKTILWPFPVIGMITYLILTLAVRFPHVINYPFEITPDNAERQYKNAVAMTRFLKTAVIFLLLYLTYATIQIAYGKLDKLGDLFLPVVAVAFVSIIGTFIYRSFKLRSHILINHKPKNRNS
jgi:hypothetical protein